MDSELSKKILRELKKIYDVDPTGIISTYDLATLMKLPEKDVQGALIYLKDKESIKSFFDEGECIQKISAQGLDELEKFDTVKNIQNENLVKQRLQSYVDELKQGKNLKNSHRVQRTSERLLEFSQRLNLTYVESNQLTDELTALIKQSFSQWNTEILSSDKKHIDDLFDKYLVSSIDDVLFLVESLLNVHQEISLKKNLPKKQNPSVLKSLFSNLQNYKTKSESQSNVVFNDEDPLEFDVSHEDHIGKIKVFISHKFVKSDQKLASTLQKRLHDENIYGYLAERKKDYDLVFGEKIKNEIKSADYLIAIITKNSQFAPSIHQEIGYAIGVNVPVRIMAEGQESKGVLAEGKDIEKFSRPTFEKFLDNVLNNIIKNGIRKKLTDTEKEELIKNVYRPCFNQMMNEYKIREFIVTIPSNKWKDLEPFWQLKTEPEMKNLFEEYSIELEKWHKTWIGFSNNFQNKRHELGQIIRQAFDKSSLLEGEMISLSDSKIAPQDWLDAFKFVLFDDKIEWDDQLYKILLDFTIKTKNGHQKWLEKWYEHKPDIFSSILELIPLLTKKLESPISLEHINNQRETLKMLIEKLTLQLEEKLK